MDKIPKFEKDPSSNEILPALLSLRKARVSVEKGATKTYPRMLKEYKKSLALLQKELKAKRKTNAETVEMDDESRRLYEISILGIEDQITTLQKKFSEEQKIISDIMPEKVSEEKERITEMLKKESN